VQAAEAADGRSAKASSRTTNSPKRLDVTPGVTPPRERKKTKNETTSTTTVVVDTVVVDAVVVARADVDELVTAKAARVVAWTDVEDVLVREVVDVVFVRVMVHEVAAPLSST